MGVTTFDFPSDIREAVILLVSAKIWNLSLLDDDGRTYIYDGDQAVFTADTRKEAESFLAGCFLGTYNGKSIDQVMNEIVSGRFVGKHVKEISEEIRGERRPPKVPDDFRR